MFHATHNYSEAELKLLRKFLDMPDDHIKRQNYTSAYKEASLVAFTLGMSGPHVDALRKAIKVIIFDEVVENVFNRGNPDFDKMISFST